MTITITSTIRAFVRLTALAILAISYTYRAGFWLGRTVHSLSDWLADAIHHPTESVDKAIATVEQWADRVLADPKPEPNSVLRVLNAQLLSPEQLDSEIEQFEKDCMPARRKSARARKVPVAA